MRISSGGQPKMESIFIYLALGDMEAAPEAGGKGLSAIRMGLLNVD